MITAEVRRQFIKELADAFAGTDFTREHDQSMIALVWDKDGLSAGAGVDEEAAWIWLADATAPVQSATEAIGLLNAVFSDEIVAVAAYEGQVWLGWALANATDLHLAPHLLVPIEPRGISRVSEVHVRSWSGALDSIRPWPPRSANQ